MKKVEFKYSDITKLSIIINKVLNTINDETSLDWTFFESIEKLKTELILLEKGIKQNDIESLKTLAMHFAPASSFQDLSLQNGWSDEYMRISAEFDSIYSRYS